jgi:hypothetical protein
MATWFELPDLPIRVTAQGLWLHGDEPLHPRVETLFASHVVPTPDGAFYIQLGYARQRIEVADTPYIVRSVDATDDPSGQLSHVDLLLSDGARERLDPATLSQNTDNVLYCHLQRHGVRVRCRFTPAQYHALALRMETEDDAFYLPMAGDRWLVALT